MAAWPPPAGLVYDVSGGTLAVVTLLAICSTAHVTALIAAAARA